MLKKVQQGEKVPILCHAMFTSPYCIRKMVNQHQGTSNVYKKDIT